MRVVACGNQDVAQLHIAVEHAVRVEVREGRRQLISKPCTQRERRRHMGGRGVQFLRMARAVHQQIQRAALHQLHHERRVAPRMWRQCALLLRSNG